MPRDKRRDKLSWRNRRANHGIRPCRGKRADWRYKKKKVKKAAAG
jgi:hypothetical protein